MKNKLLLALSGNDIFSGGGLHADLATYTVHGLHGFVAVTCLTAMTDKGFEVLPTDGHTSRVRSCPSLQGNPRCGSVGSPR